MPETMKPQFKHDCDACVLLFVTSSKDDVKRDVYYCPKSDQGTILIRWGDAPGSYASTPVSTIVTNIRHYAFDPMDTTLRGFLTAWGQGLIKMDIRKPDPLIDVPSWWIGYTKASDEIDNLWIKRRALRAAASLGDFPQHAWNNLAWEFTGNACKDSAFPLCDRCEGAGYVESPGGMWAIYERCYTDD